VLYDGLQPTTEGGREHDITFDEHSGTVLKFTKSSCAAYRVGFDSGKPELMTGLPLEYLERLLIHNEVFSDDIRFVGVAGERNRRRIVTRQNRVQGRPAEWQEIDRLMIDELGFFLLRHNYGVGYEDSRAYLRDDVAVFDLRPPNVFVTASGVLAVIDSIPVRLTGETRAVFG
jgi:hypothetical protein